jgi:2-amino-4-hydroxy-6-hydroxymethyldihydropteridine diphosphokinase
VTHTAAGYSAGSAAGDPAPAPGSAVAPLALPSWAVVTAARRAHIARVVALIGVWAAHRSLPATERQAWHDAATWHDALRDAPESALRAILGEDPQAAWAAGMPAGAAFLHGPAAAARLAADGERRADVLDAIRWHTVGSVEWGATGRALYMADFLEPGREFAHDERAALAARVPGEFDGVFREVVQMRVRWAVEGGKALAPRTVALWNAIR